VCSQYVYTFIDFSSQNQANRVQADVTKNHVGLLLSQIAPQFLKNEFAESQNRIVTQVAPQQFNPGPTSPQQYNPGPTSPQQFNPGPTGPLQFNPVPNGPQQFNPAPNSPQNIIDAITSELKIKISKIFIWYNMLGIRTRSRGFEPL